MEEQTENRKDAIKLYTIGEAATALGLNTQTVYQYILNYDNNRPGTTQLKAIKLGRSWRIRHADLEAFRNRNENTLSMDEVCEALQISRVTCSKYIKSGELAAEKHGKFWMIKQSDLEAFIASR